MRPGFRWWMSLVLLAGCAACSLSRDLAPDHPERLLSVPVLRVIDGDTLIVRLNEQEQVVRLLGVDAPELAPEPQYYAREAAEFLRHFAEGQTVWLEVPVWPSDNRDGLSAYVYRRSDREFANYEVVRRGFGRAYTPLPFTHLEPFLKAEQEARAKNLGLWGAPPLRNPAALPAGNRMREFWTWLLQMVSVGIAAGGLLLGTLTYLRNRRKSDGR